MKNRKSLILVIAFVLAFSVMAFGAQTVMKINAVQATDMTFAIDQTKWQPLETTGQPIYPIIINGRTFVPVRALLEKFGVGVDYDVKTRNIILTSKPEDTTSATLSTVMAPAETSKPLVIVYDKKRAAALGTPKLTQTTELKLSDATEIWIDGAKYDGRLENLSEKKFNVSTVKTEIDQKSGLATRVMLITDPNTDTGTGTDAALKITITVIIRIPPGDITIIIRF